jgi:hypothetical protein
VLPLLIGASVVLGGAQAILGHQAQKKQARENKKAALRNLDLIYDDLNARALEERASATQQKEMVATQAGALAGETTTSAAAGNVQGASVDALLRDVQRQEAQARLTIDTNLGNTEAQIERQRRGASVDAQNQIAGVQSPSGASLAMRLAGVGLDAYSLYKS